MDKFMIKKPRVESTLQPNAESISSLIQEPPTTPSTYSPIIDVGSLVWDPALRPPITSYHPMVVDEVRLAYLSNGPTRPARKTSLRMKKKQNHNFIVKVLVPHKVPASVSAMESYQELITMAMTKKKTRKGQNLEFSDLPSDLIESILERLSSPDRIRFGAACKKHLSFVTTTRHHFRTIDKLPWMATFFSGWADRGLVFSLFQPLHQRGQPNYADYQILDPKGEGFGCAYPTTIKACRKGWFLCLWSKEEQGKSCFLLFSPFNKTIIKLPDLDHHLDIFDQAMCKATFSLDDPSSPHCVFFFLSEVSTPEKYQISTLEDEKSGKWNTKIFDKLIGDVSSVVYHEGCFYCLSFRGQLAAYDVVQHTLNLVIIAPSPLLHLPRPLAALELVACQGKLIIAVVHSSSANLECINNVDVLRCGLFEFSSSTSTWVERTSLGDHALFLGNPTSFSVPVPSCSNVADRIYFNSSRMDKGFPIYYSFKDGRCHMSEDGDYWYSIAKFGMWIEPPSPTGW